MPNSREQVKNGSTKESKEPEIIAATAIADDVPAIEGASDERMQLSRLSLALMRTTPELSKMHNMEVEQALLFGKLTGLTGPKELPKAKAGEEKITYGLVGQIEGVNLLTGEMFQAGIVYLPGGFHELFRSQMEQHLGPADPVTGIRQGHGSFELQFALKFISIPANNPRGYSWKAANQLPAQQSDPLARLRQRALAGVKIGDQKQLASMPGADAKLIEGTASRTA